MEEAGLGRFGPGEEYLRQAFRALRRRQLAGFRVDVGDGNPVRRHLNPLQSVKEEELVAAAREVLPSIHLLRKLHSGRNNRPIAQTLVQSQPVTCSEPLITTCSPAAAV